MTYGPMLPDLYIKIVYHPHSNQESWILPISSETPTAYYPAQTQECHTKPFTPFRTLEDFEFTEVAIQSLMPKEIVNWMLAGINGRWINGESRLTLRNYADMEKSLHFAHQYVTQVQVMVVLWTEHLLSDLSVVQVRLSFCRISWQDLPLWFWV